MATAPMRESKHTPGPWRVEEGTTLIWGACDPDDHTSYGMGYPVAEVRVLLGNKRPLLADACHEESKANAYLTAAGPDLLEAAKDALSGWQYIRTHHGDLYGVGWDRVERALAAAIAKAEGRSDG